MLPSLTPDVTVEQLRAMPAGSLRREYARLLDFDGIERFELSPEVEGSCRRARDWALWAHACSPL